MATEPVNDAEHAPAAKVIGLGAPISVRICFEACEIPALIDAIAEELAGYHVARRGNGRANRLAANRDPARWADHIGELDRMRTELRRTVRDPTTRRIAVVWPTLLAHGVLHRAVDRARERAERVGAGSSDPDAVATARVALSAAQRSQRDFDAVDNGGLDAVWL